MAIDWPMNQVFIWAGWMCISKFPLLTISNCKILGRNGGHSADESGFHLGC